MKIQIPSFKLQRNFNIQASICDLKFGASLELGTWLLGAF
jgi:hypothetical protein